MRQTLTYGSVRGAAGNGGPYRDSLFLTVLSFATGGSRRVEFAILY